MKLLSPVSRVYEVQKVIEEGADEIYCGVLTPIWHDSYIGVSINRRPDARASFKTFEELQQTVEIAHSYNKPVYFTMNQQYYTEKQYPEVLDYVEKALKLGVDGFIVGSLDLLLTLNKMDVNTKIIVSTTGAAFNSEAVNFYRELGANRVILPRHLTLKEIASIAKNTSDVELEVFILNSRCPNVEGYCTFLHGLATPKNEGLYKNACMLPYKVTVIDSGSGLDVGKAIRRQKIWEQIHMDSAPCGVCALYELNEIGITGVKIIGRDNPPWKKVIDVIFVRMLLDFLERQKPSKELFRVVAKQLYAQYKAFLINRSSSPETLHMLTVGCSEENPCRACTCYFPEVMV